MSADLGNTRCGLAVSAIIQGEAIAARRSCYSLPGQAVQGYRRAGKIPLTGVAAADSS